MATKIKEIYYCKICGNKVIILEEGRGTLVCCSKNMSLIDK